MKIEETHSLSFPESSWASFGLPCRPKFPRVGNRPHPDPQAGAPVSLVNRAERLGDLDKLPFP